MVQHLLLNIIAGNTDTMNFGYSIQWAFEAK